MCSVIYRKLAFLYLKCMLLNNTNVLIVFSEDVLKAGAKCKRTADCDIAIRMGIPLLLYGLCNKKSKTFNRCIIRVSDWCF